MIKKISTENYKSIQNIELELGRVTVLIGENGCGKSNVLEAIALGAAAASDKLDNEFLASRGVRVTEAALMRAAFDKNNLTQDIKISFGEECSYSLRNNNQPYAKWIVNAFASKPLPNLREFIIYSPEYHCLRNFREEGQILPLGINGEGLFKLLQVFSLDQNKFNQIKDKLKLMGWFKDFKLPQSLFVGERAIQIEDRFLDQEVFDQKSTNEGFLFLLFYFCLFISDDTPKFFAIDNIDASLNPRLCRRLIIELVKLAKTYQKQVIFTTHNPAILDGLNLNDDEQRLFVISRNKAGYSRARRFLKPETPEGEEPVKMSEAFLRGYIGGLPKGF